MQELFETKNIINVLKETLEQSVKKNLDEINNIKVILIYLKKNIILIIIII